MLPRCWPLCHKFNAFFLGRFSNKIALYDTWIPGMTFLLSEDCANKNQYLSFTLGTHQVDIAHKGDSSTTSTLSILQYL